LRLGRAVPPKIVTADGVMTPGTAPIQPAQDLLGGGPVLRRSRMAVDVAVLAFGVAVLPPFAGILPGAVNEHLPPETAGDPRLPLPCLLSVRLSGNGAALSSIGCDLTALDARDDDAVQARSVPVMLSIAW
jgi:hypothetical protein